MLRRARSSIGPGFKQLSDMEQKPAAVAWHALSTEEALKALNSDSTSGLSSEEAARRLSEHGPNRLPEAPPPSLLSRLWGQISDITVLALLGAALVSAALAFFGG